MQRERSALDSFPEPIDLNQGSLANNTSVDHHHSPSWENVLNPVENRFSNYTNASNNSSQNFTSWDRGESSSSANQTEDDPKMRLGWPSTFNGSDSRSESSWPFEPANISINQVTARPPLGLQNYSLNLTSLSIREHDCLRNTGAGPPQQLPGFYAYSNNTLASSGSSSFSEANDVSDPSFSTWGSSCKRDAFESTSAGQLQFFPGGSSSSNQLSEKTTIHHGAPSFYTSPGDLSISSGPLNLSSPNQNSEPLNPMSHRVGSGGFSPSSSLPGIAETSSRNFGIRPSNHVRHEPIAFDTSSRSASLRNFGVFPGRPTRPVTNTDSSEMRSAMTLPMNPSNMNQPHLMPSNEARGMHSYSWNGSRGIVSSSSSFMVPGESNIRSSSRTNLEYPNPMTVSAPETTRNVLQDQIDWSFAPGTSSASSRNHSSVGPASGARSSSSYASWLPHQSQTSQRMLEGAGWIPFPLVESESGNRRNHFGLLPDEAASASAANRRSQLDQRSSALMDMPGDDIPGWRALAAVERRRLIRQVLNAMRRGGQAEDYMLIDPFMNGFAELNDRHRDMRLDVDNMSYEELLALEERIGNVNTGLSDDKISVSMKQRKYGDAMGSTPNLEPCCVCQEDYIGGDDIGILDCGHEFHTNCIKQWLRLKNICPICKMMALQT